MVRFALAIVNSVVAHATGPVPHGHTETVHAPPLGVAVSWTAFVRALPKAVPTICEALAISIIIETLISSSGRGS